ncbi:hypothetical protein ABZ319_08175 [Nocardia sp. NPDC005978]|uniref:hypothetical protein n=1 Tax=Nocardia sp. NPDC005978 TaxID=3156725 RepID=UPI0033B46EB3
MSELALEFDWDEPIRNTLLDDDDERDLLLADQLGLLRDEAVFGLGIAAAEWVVARMGGHGGDSDLADVRLRIEAMWALCAEPRYARLTDPPVYADHAEPRSVEPLWVCSTLLFWLYGSAVQGDELQGECMSLILLARRLMGPHREFARWLSDAIAQATLSYAVADDDPDDEDAQLVWKPVPPESFWPGFAWTTIEDAHARVDAFLSGLDPARNPYLRTADDMLTHGFAGTPYGG